MLLLFKKNSFYNLRILDEVTVKLGGLESNRHELSNVEHLVISACGTSLYASTAGSELMRELGSFKTVQVVDAAELGQEILPKENAGLLVISQSGETKDVNRALMIAQTIGIPCLSVVNSVGYVLFYCYS